MYVAAAKAYLKEIKPVLEEAAKTGKAVRRQSEKTL